MWGMGFLTWAFVCVRRASLNPKHKNIWSERSATAFSFCEFCALCFFTATRGALKQLILCISASCWFDHFRCVLPPEVSYLTVFPLYFYFFSPPFQWCAISLLAVCTVHCRTGQIFLKDFESITACLSGHHHALLCEISCQDIHYLFQMILIKYFVYYIIMEGYICASDNF